MICEKAKWIKPITDMGDVVPEFECNFSVKKKIKKAIRDVKVKLGLKSK